MKLSLQSLLIISAATFAWHVNAMKQGDRNTPITIVNISDQEILVKDEVSGNVFNLHGHSFIELPERHNLEIKWKDARLNLRARNLTGEALVIAAGKNRFGKKHWFGSGSLEARLMTLEEVNAKYPESISASSSCLLN